MQIKASIEAEHYRFENFKDIGSKYREYLVRGCRDDDNNAHSWQVPRQYKEGNDTFWVQASMSKPSVPDSMYYAYAEISANFEENKSYMLNRQRNGFNVSIWVQEVDTGIVVSNTVKTTYKPELINENKRRQEICGYVPKATF